MARPASIRSRLAQLAARAAVSVDGVSGLYAPAGGLHVSEVDGERLAGVGVVVAGGGRHDVTLRLLARPVPLHALADQVRERVRSRAATAGLDAAVGTIDVRIDGIVEAS